MLVRIMAAAIAACIVVPSPAAEACHNAVEWTTDDYVRVLVRAEKLIESGQYARAKRTLGRISFSTPALKQRAKNVHMILALRIRDGKLNKESLVTHFKARTADKATSKDVRYHAWLAEALVAAGRPDEARPILVDLHTRDLMPDAYAYHNLARLSSGTERYEYYKACRTRTENKNLCELPAEVKSSVQARR
jgi:predicted Zn-dependent protease